IEQPGFFAIHVAPAIHYTMGGIHITPKTQVLDGNGQVIPGLFAAGEVAGGLHGNNRVGGNSIAETVVFGRQAGQQVTLYLRNLK
ncbi:MAG TPA: FAD-binding protein, partial [Limosilactobacillus ingluviei]|nr:FAD-binding protein [Limosilactobacillus ingluviei]